MMALFFFITALNAASVLGMPPIYEHVTKGTILRAIVDSVNPDFLDGEDSDEETASTCSLDSHEKEVIRLTLDHESIFDTTFFDDEDFDLPGFITNIRKQSVLLKTFEKELRSLFEISCDSFIPAARRFLEGKMPGNEDPQERLAFALALVIIDQRFYDVFRSLT